MGRGRCAVLVTLALAGCLPRRPAPAPPPPAAVPDDLSHLLQEGTPAPEVAGVDRDDKAWPLTRLRGQYVVLYFYPMDFAAGASAQAEAFRADFPRFRQLGASIVGVSTDEPNVHRDFAAKYKLPYKLLSDPHGQMAAAFGVPLQAGTIRHATFLIDRRGVIRKVWPRVQPWGHAREVLEALRALEK